MKFDTINKFLSFFGLIMVVSAFVGNGKVTGIDKIWIERIKTFNKRSKYEEK